MSAAMATPRGWRKMAAARPTRRPSGSGSVLSVASSAASIASYGSKASKASQASKVSKASKASKASRASGGGGASGVRESLAQLQAQRDLEAATATAAATAATAATAAAAAAASAESPGRSPGRSPGVPATPPGQLSGGVPFVSADPELQRATVYALEVNAKMNARKARAKTGWLAAAILLVLALWGVLVWLTLQARHARPLLWRAPIGCDEGGASCAALSAPTDLEPFLVGSAGMLIAYLQGADHGRLGPSMQRIWAYMDTYGHIWTYMDIYGIYGAYMGHIWAYMGRTWGQRFCVHGVHAYRLPPSIPNWGTRHNLAWYRIVSHL